MGGGTVKTVMGLGGEVQVTAATAAIAVVAEAGLGRIGREDKRLLGKGTMLFRIAKESWVAIMAVWEIYDLGGTWNE